MTVAAAAGVFCPARVASRVALGRADARAAEPVGIGRTAAVDVRAIQRREPTGDIIGALRAGDLNFLKASRKAGLAGRARQEAELDRVRPAPVPASRRCERGRLFGTVAAAGDVIGPGGRTLAPACTQRVRARPATPVTVRDPRLSGDS